MKDILIEAILEIESHPNVIKCSGRNDKETLNIIEDYFKQEKYNRTIELGKKFLKNAQLCNQCSIQGETLVAKAIFWGDNFAKGMDQMELLYPIVSKFKNSFKKEYIIVCEYLTPRLYYIGTCYPEVYSVPYYIVRAIVIAVFAIPSHHNPSNQEQTNQPPISTVPENTMLSPSKMVATRDEFELTMVNYTLTPISYMKYAGTQAADYIVWIGNKIGYIYSQCSLIRFMINVVKVFIRLYLFLAILFYLSIHCISSWLTLFITCTKIAIILMFRFPHCLFFPSTLKLINFVIRILEILMYYMLVMRRIFFFILFFSGSSDSLDLATSIDWVNSMFE